MDFKEKLTLTFSRKLLFLQNYASVQTARTTSDSLSIKLPEIFLPDSETLNSLQYLLPSPHSKFYCRVTWGLMTTEKTV